MILNKVRHTKFVPMFYLAPYREDVWDVCYNGNKYSMKVL